MKNSERLELFLKLTFLNIKMKLQLSTVKTGSFSIKCFGCLYLFKLHMVKNFKTFWKELYFRTQRQPSYLNNGLHDTPQSPGKVTTGWEKSLQSLSDFLATVILKLDHININRGKRSTSDKCNELWFTISVFNTLY